LHLDRDFLIYKCPIIKKKKKKKKKKIKKKLKKIKKKKKKKKKKKSNLNINVYELQQILKIIYINICTKNFINNNLNNFNL